MSLNLKIQKRVLNFTKEKKQVYVATPDRGNVIGPDKIAELIAKDTGTRPAQVKMILGTLIDSMMSWLEEGHGVKLGNFGSFMPTAKSASSEVPEEVGVKRMWVTFYASKQLKNRLDEVKYSTENEFAVETEKEDSGSSSGGNSTGSGTGNNPL